jgi:hypothetical protein
VGKLKANNHYNADNVLQVYCVFFRQLGILYGLRNLCLVLKVLDNVSKPLKLYHNKRIEDILLL